MNNYFKKVKFILPTYLLIYASVTAFLYFARFILEYKLQLFELDIMLWNFWIPPVVSIIPLIIFLRPRLGVLTFNEKTNERRSIFFYLSLVGIVVTCSISQHYLYDSTGDLVEVSLPSKIDNINRSKYYKINRYILNEQKISLYVNTSVSGKHNNYLNFDYYFVFPVLDSRESYEEKVSNVWFLKKFHEQISNNESDTKKQNFYSEFLKKNLHELERFDFSKVQYFERVPSSENQKMALRAIGKVIPVVLERDSSNFPIILEPINEKFEKRAGNKLLWIFGSFGITTALFLLLLIWPKFSITTQKKILSGTYKHKDDLNSFLKIFIPRKGQFITAIILDVNILLFILFFISSFQIDFVNHIQLLNWGANRRFEVLNGEWWRLITNIFMHGNFLHLLYNSISLFLVSILLEPILGRVKFLSYYIISGVLASLVSIIYYENTISVGASGAIFGLFGVLIYSEFLSSKKQSFNNKFILYYFGGYVLINLIYGLLVPGIDNAAHFGGFVSGLLLGYLNTIIDSEDEFKVKRS